MRRSKMEMYIDILKVLAQNGPLKLTHVMYKANVNCSVLKEYLDFLIKQNLIEEQVTPKKRNKSMVMEPKEVASIRGLIFFLFLFFFFFFLFHFFGFYLFLAFCFFRFFLFFLFLLFFFLFFLSFLLFFFFFFFFFFLFFSLLFLLFFFFFFSRLL